MQIVHGDGLHIIGIDDSGPSTNRTKYETIFDIEFGTDVDVGEYFNICSEDGTKFLCYDGTRRYV